MELDFGVVGRSMDGGVSQSTFKAVSEDESAYKWGVAFYQKENGDKILYLIIGLCTALIFIHFENTHEYVTTILIIGERGKQCTLYERKELERKRVNK